MEQRRAYPIVLKNVGSAYYVQIPDVNYSRLLQDAIIKYLDLAKT